MSASIVTFNERIGDGEEAIALVVRREADTVIFAVDGDPVALPLDEAAKLANDGRKIAAALAVKAPKAGPVYIRKIGYADGRVEPFEIGIADAPVGVSFIWAAKRLVLPLDRGGERLLFALERIGEAVDDIRQAFRSYAMPPPPPPGELWRTWRPRFTPPEPGSDW